MDFQAIHAIAHQNTRKEVIGTDPYKLHERRMMRMHEAQRRAAIYNRGLDRRDARAASNTAADKRQESRSAEMSYQFAARSNKAHAARQQAAADRLTAQMAPKQSGPASTPGRRATRAAPAPSAPSTPMPVFHPANPEAAAGAPTRSLLPPPQAQFRSPMQFNPVSPSPRYSRPTGEVPPVHGASTDPMWSRPPQAPLSAERTAAEGLSGMQFSKPRRKAPRNR